MGISINQDLLGLLGIAVSVILFVIGYRQTIGAKNERVAAANKEIERILIRRIVLESYAPTRDDMARLLVGKARDFRVKDDDLASEPELFTAIFTRIFESDLIPSAQRDEILTRLGPVMAEADRESLVEAEKADVRRPAGINMWSLFWFALAISAVSGIVVILLQPGALTSGLGAWLLPVVVTFAGSLGAIGIFVWLIRFRATQEGTTRESGVGQLVILEKQVNKILSGAGKVEERGRSKGGFGYSYLLSRGDTKILVEAKLLRKLMPSSLISAVISRAEETARELGASEVIIVTSTPVGLEDGQPPSKIVKFMTPNELRDHLVRVPATHRNPASALPLN